ncbi:MAG: hypothetical protein E5W70_08925 [Mesorhizobium sp.]|nr:MAG: hypothetical protein E5W70_08925 [Mesorhizobium sp.]
MNRAKDVQSLPRSNWHDFCEAFVAAAKLPADSPLGCPRNRRTKESNMIHQTRLGGKAAPRVVPECSIGRLAPTTQQSLATGDWPLTARRQDSTGMCLTIDRVRRAHP